jgi:hypothetical protein
MSESINDSRGRLIVKPDGLPASRGQLPKTRTRWSAVVVECSPESTEGVAFQGGRPLVRASLDGMPPRGGGMKCVKLGKLGVSLFLDQGDYSATQSKPVLGRGCPIGGMDGMVTARSGRVVAVGGWTSSRTGVAASRLLVAKHQDKARGCPSLYDECFRALATKPKKPAG